MRSAVLLLSLAAVCLLCATVAVRADFEPADLLQRVSSGQLLGPSAQMELRRAVRRLSADAKVSLKAESDASQSAYVHARKHPKKSPVRSPSAGPDFSSIPSVLNPFMQCRGITGLSVGIVSGGKVVYSNGFGVQDQSGTLVDADTLFGIGSVTKSFTSGLAAMAQQDGLFDFDQLYSSYLPGFAMNDAPSSALLSTRDLLTHRTGVASHDTALFLNTVPDTPTESGRRKKVFDFKYLPSVDVPARFRTRFVYSNWQVTAAGYMLGELYNEAPNGDWESLVTARIFKPLGMARTCSNFTQCVDSPNRATPMQWDPTTKTFVDFPYEYNYVINQAAPCGAIASTANELSQWMLTHLGHHPELLSAASLYELHSPSMTWASAEPLVPNWLYLRAHGYAYGMNFWIGDYNGEKLVWHQGDVWGFRALFAMLPESDIGVVLLSNSDSADSIAPNQMWWRSIIEFYLFDLVQQNPNPTFPNGAADMCNFPCNILPSLCPADAKAPLSSSGSIRDADIDDVEIVNAPSLSDAPVDLGANAIPVVLSDYLGVFRQEAYGNVSITWTNSTQSQLLMTMGNFIDMPPTATGLNFQSDGGSDRFSWPIGDEEAQTLSNSYVDFLRDSTNGGLVTWMWFQAVDDDGLQMDILFNRIADGEGNPITPAPNRPPVRGIARSSSSSHMGAQPLPSRRVVESAQPLVDELVQMQRASSSSSKHEARSFAAAAAGGAVSAPAATTASTPLLSTALVWSLVILLGLSVWFGSVHNSKQIEALRITIEQQHNGVQRA